MKCKCCGVVFRTETQELWVKLDTGISRLPKWAQQICSDCIHAYVFENPSDARQSLSLTEFTGFIARYLSTIADRYSKNFSVYHCQVFTKSFKGRFAVAPHRCSFWARGVVGGKYVCGMHARDIKAGHVVQFREHSAFALFIRATTPEEVVIGLQKSLPDRWLTQISRLLESNSKMAPTKNCRQCHRPRCVA